MKLDEELFTPVTEEVTTEKAPVTEEAEVVVCVATPKCDAYRKYAVLDDNAEIDVDNLNDWAVDRACCFNCWDKEQFMEAIKEELGVTKKLLTEATIGDEAEKINAEPVKAEGEEDKGIVEIELDRALKRAKFIQGKALKRQYPNVLLIGEGGLGKTGMVTDWARKNGINLVSKKCATMDETDLGGAMSPDTENKGVAQRLTTDDFDSLDKPNSVLFLDEYNRARAEVRTPLMELINNHIIPDNRHASGNRFLPNFLFTIAAINPPNGRYNTDEMDDAENTRFAHVNVVALKNVFKRHLLGNLKDELAVADTEEEKKEIEGRMALADAILSAKEFEFDDEMQRDKNHDTPGWNKLPLDYRSFEQAINNSDGTKDDFLNNWKKNSNNLKYNMIDRILQNYVDIDDKANDALKGGTDSEVFKKEKTNFEKVQDILKGLKS